MGVNSDLARIYGSDLDSISLAELGTALPDELEALGGGFEEVGWISPDGITETPTGSVEKIRGHQGNGVVRTRVSEPGTTIGFAALESKALTNRLRYHVKSSTSTAGVRKELRGAGQRVIAMSAVIDLFDQSDDDVRGRFIIPRFEIAPDGERLFGNTEIAHFPFVGEIIGDYYFVETDLEAEDEPEV